MRSLQHEIGVEEGHLFQCYNSSRNHSSFFTFSVCDCDPKLHHHFLFFSFGERKNETCCVFVFVFVCVKKEG